MLNNLLDSQAQAYFNALPVLLQTQIVESGVKLKTKEELEQYCRNVLGQPVPPSPNETV